MGHLRLLRHPRRLAWRRARDPRPALAARPMRMHCWPCYQELEPAVQAGRGIPYREVMAETLAADGVGGARRTAAGRGGCSWRRAAHLAASSPRSPAPSPSCADVAGGLASCRTPTRTCSPPRSRRSACRSTCASSRPRSAPTSPRPATGRPSSRGPGPIASATSTWPPRSSTTSSRRPPGTSLRVDQSASGAQRRCHAPES